MHGTLVGVLGALLVVGGMLFAIEAREAPTPTDEEGGSGMQGPPPQVGRDLWTLADCEVGYLTWTPPVERLREVVAPNWEPASGPVPGRGLFVLLVYECERHTLNGLPHASTAGGLAVVPVLAPDDPHNVSAVDEWGAVAEWTGDPRILDVAARHGFTTAGGGGSVDVQETPLGPQLSLVHRTDAGQVTATALLADQGEAGEVTRALVATAPGTFGVARGTETYTLYETGTATVQASGETWVSRLGLEPVPFAVGLERGFEATFTLWSEPRSPMRA